MKPAAEKMKKFLEKTIFKNPNIQPISNVTALPIEKDRNIKDLLYKQIFSQVRWRESVNFMINNGINDFIEIGPGKVLSGLVKRTNDKVSTKSLNKIDDIKNLKMNSLKDKKVLITGATGGIGGSLVKKFMSLNAKVLGTGQIQKNLEKLKKENSEIKVKKFDISSHSEIEKFIDEVSEELGGLDILINNAGINRDNLSLRMKDDEWQKVIDINLTSTFLLSKYAIKKMMKSNSGRVINITSIVGHTGNIGQSNYAASKSGTIGMSKSLSIEYAKKNITINCVSKTGFIVSDMTNSIPEKIRNILLSKIPMGKMGSGDDVSNCVAFLSSDEASYITGETIHVNGGMYMA